MKQNQVDEFPQLYSPPSQYPDVARSALYIRMSDGIRIAIDLYLPAPLENSTRLPAILLQTRYWRAARLHPQAGVDPADPLASAKMSNYKRRFLAQGYAWVDMDVRGTGASFGDRQSEFSDQEVRDGGEVIDWIIQQPWSSGMVGALGISYDGTTAELLMANCHPALKASAPMFALFDAYLDVAFPGGIRSDWFLDTWGYFNEILDRNEVPDASQGIELGVLPVDEDTDGSLLAEAVDEHRRNIPVRQQLEGIAYRDDRSAHDARVNLDAISPSFKQDQVAKSGTAIYSISGWFDGAYPHSAIKRFLTLPNPGSKLLIGPWNHGGWTNISPYKGGPAEFDLPEELLRFFDFHLKGIDTGIEQEKRIHYFTMGAECWKGSNTWPPVSTPAIYYFNPNGLLADKPPEADGGSDLYAPDYQAGTGERTRWNSLIGMPIENPYPDRAEQDARLLCYTTQPLGQDCEVTGHPVVQLFLQVDAGEVDVFVYLEDVDPQGQVSYVTEDILRASQRKLSFEPPSYRTPAPWRSFRRADAVPVEPDETMQLVFDLIPTSYVFRQGHAIRIALAGADKDHFYPSGKGPSTWQVFHDRQKPSHISLPVVKS